MRCLIIDDDPLICDLLQHFCTKVEPVLRSTVANTGLEAVNLLNQQSYDVIFLDFHLPDLTGKELLSIVPGNSSVVMITSNKEFGSESYNYDQIIDFLVKPINFARFVKSLQKIKGRKANQETVNENLFVKDGNDLVKVNLKEVLYIKSSSNYAQLVFKGKKLMTIMTMKELESKLPSYFQRIHRSTIVNINCIESISKNKVVIDTDEIAISESYRDDLLNRIDLLS